MLGSLFKNLTFILLSWGTFSLTYAQTLSQQEFKTHLRWTLNTPKEQVSIKKSQKKIILETLNETLYQLMVGDIAKFDKKSSYIKSFQYSKENFPSEPAKIIIELKDNSVELFSFFKEGAQKYMLDFWINKDRVVTKKAAVVKNVKPEKSKISKKLSTIKKANKQVLPSKNQASTQGLVSDSAFDIIDPEKILESKVNLTSRDFRYGAAFIWDYRPLLAPLEKDVNLRVKSPDYLYEIKDRDFESNPKEAHLQLSIKFFRQKKWGLMTKSIKLYEKKYGTDEHRDLNDFMKATSLIKNTIKEEIKPIKEGVSPEDAPAPVTESSAIFAGINILNNIIERTDDYELKSALLRYVLQYRLDRKDYVKALQTSKKLYVASTENFHDEMIIYSSKVILNSLAKLKQLSKIEDFLNNKAVQRVLPKQEGKGYVSFVKLMNNQEEELIKDYEINAKSYARPVHPSILYNTAEAYFRQANYEKAIKLFDEFIYHYPQLKVAGHARLRLALSYDLLDRPVKKVLKLYENAINRAVDPEISYESKLRYVGLRVARNRKLDKRDLETISFLEKSPAEKKSQNSETKKLLWLIRLRTYIAQEKYNDAVAYLTTLPLESLNLVDQRTFEGDGAEIIVGLIKQLYLNEDYARVVKIWEVYKNKYEAKVAKSPYLSFMVCDAFLNLSLYDSFERAFKHLQSIKNKSIRTFPKWVKEHKNLVVSDYIRELQLIKYIGKKQWNEAQDYLEGLNDKDRKTLNYNFYKGLVSYNLQKYNNTVESFERILTQPNQENILSPRQTTTMLINYVESLYQSNNQIRFQKNAVALIKDIRKGGNKAYQGVLERIEYLLIESINGEKETNHLLIEKRAQNFISNYSKSNYLSRVQYLYGVSLLKNQKEKLGKEVLNKLINNNETPEYLKGLARSELSGLLIKNKTL